LSKRYPFAGWLHPPEIKRLSDQGALTSKEQVPVAGTSSHADETVSGRRERFGSLSEPTGLVNAIVFKVKPNAFIEELPAAGRNQGPP
jgi:hypothetical protein